MQLLQNWVARWMQRVSRSIRSSVVIPKPPISPTSISSQVLKSALVVGVVIEAILGTAVGLVVLRFWGLDLVLGFDFFALALLLAFIIGSLGPLAGLMIANV
jgi:hypothetical protein